MFTKILVPHDTSAAADNALDHAKELARKFNAKIHLVSVLSSLPTHTSDRLHRLHWSRKGKVQSFLDSILGSLGRAGISAEYHILEDDYVSEALIEYINRSDADLVVMGTHGFTGFTRLWLGSVADKVRHHLNPPLLLIRQSTT